MIYDNIKRNSNNIVDVKNKVYVSYVRGPRVEIVGNADTTYKVEFIDNFDKTIKFETYIRNNHWAKCNHEYFIDWKIRVWENNILFYEEDYNVTGKRVYIAMDSKAIGDTIAWFPYLEEFQKKHKCELIVSTFHNKLFKKQYTNFKFEEPGSIVNNLYAMYSLGLFYNEDGTPNLFKNPKDPKSVTMQQMATDILGLEYSEIKPRLPKKNIQKDDKLITIAEDLVNNNKVRELIIFTSIEATGRQAEYVRFGLNAEEFWSNIDKILTKLPKVKGMSAVICAEPANTSSVGLVNVKASTSPLALILPEAVI